MTISMQYKIFIPIILIFVVGTWFIANNSYRISRDEMWYTDYSIHWNDSETSDIRHITEIDIHQAAFPPLFRLMQRFSIGLWGKSFFGLRALNLIFAILMVVSVSFLMFKYQLSIFWVGLFCFLFLFDPAVSNYLHHIRPDWIVESCLVMMASLVFIYIKEKEKKFLYVGAMIGGIASGTYWNGLAMVAGFIFVLTIMTVQRLLPFKSYIKVLVVTFLALFVFFITPILYYLSETIALFSLDGAQTTNLLTGGAITAFFSSFIQMFRGLFVLGKYQLMLGSLLFIAILVTCGHFFSKGDRKPFQIMFYGWLWILFFLLIVSLRGGGLRHIYFLLPLFYLITVTGVGFLRFSMKNRAVVGLLVAYLSILCVVTAATKPMSWLKSSGQWEAYKKYSKELNAILTDKKGRIFTTFDTAWALDSYPKLFLETTSFKESEDYDQIKQLFEKYNVEYFLVHERSRIRMNGLDEFGIGNDWYQNWDRFLKEKCYKIGVVYNKYYQQNKGLPPQDPKGFRTEVWLKK